MLSSPPVLLMSASSPRTVFWLVKQPCWQVARACGESANQASGMRRNASRKGDRFIEFLVSEVLVFISSLFPDWLIVRLQA